MGHVPRYERHAGRDGCLNERSIRVRLPVGRTRLQTFLIDEAGAERGAYYVCPELLEPVFSPAL